MMLQSKGKFDNTIPFYERYFLLFELFSIIIFLFLTFIEIVYSCQLLDKVFKAKEMYFYQLVTERLKIDSYISNLIVVEKMIYVQKVMKK